MRRCSCYGEEDSKPKRKPLPMECPVLFELSAHAEASREHIATLCEAVIDRRPLGAPIAGPAARIAKNGSSERHDRVHGSERTE